MHFKGFLVFLVAILVTCGFTCASADDHADARKNTHQSRRLPGGTEAIAALTRSKSTGNLPDGVTWNFVRKSDDEIAKSVKSATKVAELPAEKKTLLQKIIEWIRSNFDRVRNKIGRREPTVAQ